MDDRPPQPPEGRLIASALKASGLSIREASRRAGISYGRWRQITSGVQNVSPGSYAAVRAPAETLARMARVVGVTPQQLEDEAMRPDAAAALRGMPAMAPPSLSVVRSPAADPEEAERRKIAEVAISLYPRYAGAIEGIMMQRQKTLDACQAELRDLLRLVVAQEPEARA